MSDSTGLPDYLYHGTDPDHIEDVFQNGLKPRSETGRSNWEENEMESIENHVYLTQNYAGYFGKSAVEDGEEFAIYEVDYSQLHPWCLYPDEDFIEQASRKGFLDDYFNDEFRSELSEGSIQERTAEVREYIEAYQPLWDASIKILGSVSHRGTIPGDVIRKVSVVNPSPGLMFDMMDPSISIENAMTVGEKYRVLNRFFMGYDVTAEEYARAKMLGAEPDEQAVAAIQERMDETEIDVRMNPNYTEAAEKEREVTPQDGT